MIRDSQNTERTVEQYVRGIVNMDLSDEVIANILSEEEDRYLKRTKEGGPR